MKKFLLLVLIFIVGFLGCAKNKGDDKIITNPVTLVEDVSDNIVYNEATDMNNATPAINENSDSKSFEPDFTNIKEIMGMDKDKVTNRLGNNYEIIGAGAESSEEGYSYQEYDIVIIFQNEKISLIECGDKVSIKGAKVGMTFSDIKSILGEEETKKTVQIEPFQPQYALYYKFDNFIVWFGAIEKEGNTSCLQIRRNNK